ncbi:MAG: hypothetical protein LBH19_06525 [Dysgonamonadaceae bacterium]|jgi:hypothetical protein|nr:hypothetical protein [Dysgonamonadaceae bacterium]
MAEYGFKELVMEIADSKKLFAENAFKKAFSNEDTREIYLSACENIANVYLPYGFKYSKSRRHLRLIQKNNEFIYQISFWSGHYNIPGENVALSVFANVLSHKYKNWKLENKNKLNIINGIVNEYICGGNIGNLRKDHKYLKWNIGKAETREKEIENIIDNINKLAIPFFQHFNNADKLKDELENNSIDYYFDRNEIGNFYKYIMNEKTNG